MARSKKRIALLMDYVFSQFQEQIHQGAASYANKSNLDIYFMGMGNYGGMVVEDEARSDILNMISPESFDGIIIVSTTFGDNPFPPKLVEHLNRLKDMPILSIGHSIIGEPHIDMDNPYGMEQVMKHLLQMHNYKEFVFVSGPLENIDSQERLSGFKKALAEAEIPFADEHIYEGNFASSGGKQAVEYFLEQKRYKPDIFVCANDAMALGVLDGLKERGLSVPFDIALTGYDGLMLYDSISHQFTTYDQSFYNAGYIATENLHQMLQGRELCHRERLKGKLLIGSSCGCILPENRRQTGTEFFCQDPFFHNFQMDLKKYIARKKEDREFKILAKSLTSTLLNLQNNRRSILNLNDFLLSCAECFTSEKELMARLLLYHHEFCESYYYGVYENNVNIHNRIMRVTNYIEALLERQSLHNVFTIPYDEISRALGNCEFHVVEFREFNQFEPGGDLIYSTFPQEVSEKWDREKTQWFPDENGSMVVSMITHGTKSYGYYLISENLSDYKFYQLISKRISSITRNQRNLYKQQTANRELRIQIEERKEIEIELRKTLDKVKQLSIEDELTGLHNRRGFFTLANQRITLLRRENTHFIVLYMDIDGLKKINDTHGHNHGDRAISKAAEIIKRALRESDILARLGGDEFTALMVQKNSSDSKGIKERIHRECLSFNQQHEYTWELHISIGSFSVNPENRMNLDEILAIADNDLYKKKKARKKKNRPS